MSQENVQLACEVMAALSRRDLVGLDALTDPDIEWHSFFAGLGEGGVYRGHQGTRRYLSDLNDAWKTARADVDDGIGVGDIAVLVGRLHYCGRSSGVETDAAAGWVLKFREGRAIYFQAFRDPERAFEALGLQE